MGLFGKKTPSTTTTKALSKTSLAMEMRIRQTLGIRKLDPMPVQAARAFQLASSPKSTTNDFVKVIEADEALTARIVRIANSVYFRRSEEAKDIEKAVANIGLNELRSLISATMLRSLLQGTQKTREQVWANAVAVAISCKTLSHHTTIDEGQAFLCGLLHDVGKLVMIRCGGKLYDSVVNAVASGKQTFPEAEEQFFDLNHTEVGKWIGEKWSFPESALRAIAFHHHAWAKDEQGRRRGTSHAMLVKAADTLTHAAGIGHPGGFRQFQERAQEDLPQAMQQLGIDKSEGKGLVEKLQQQFHQEYSLYQMENL